MAVAEMRRKALEKIALPIAVCAQRSEKVEIGNAVLRRKLRNPFDRVVKVGETECFNPRAPHILPWQRLDGRWEDDQLELYAFLVRPIAHVQQELFGDGPR